MGRLARALAADTRVLGVRDAKPMHNPGAQVPVHWVRAPGGASRGAARRRSLLQHLFAALRLLWCSSGVVWLSPGGHWSDAGLQPLQGGSGGCWCWFCSGEDPGDVHSPGSLWVSDHRPQQQLHALLHGPVAGFQRHRPDNRCPPPGTPRAPSPGRVGGLWLSPEVPGTGASSPCAASQPGWC